MTIRTATPVPEVVPLLILTVMHFKILTMACVNTIFSTTKHTSAFLPALLRETEKLPNPYWFGGKKQTCHCHSHAFHSKCRLDLFNGRANERQVLG